MGVNYWQPLLPKLMQLKQRIIIYSRAGNGSSSTAYDVSIEQSNIRLHKLLVSVNAEQNILLVGHSYGGLHVREYAIAYPNTVIGMLLLDPSHEQFSKKLTELDKKWAEKDDKRLDTLLADSQEWKNLQGIYLRAQLGDNGHINQTPTVIITSSKLGESEWWIGHSEQGKKLWRELHTSLIAHNPNSAHIVSNLVGHNIPIDSPNMVIEAINQSIKLTKNLSAQSR
jgi:pimeloyl-ACP methyl ester carboxylesterase